MRKKTILHYSIIVLLLLLTRFDYCRSLGSILSVRSWTTTCDSCMVKSLESMTFNCRSWRDQTEWVHQVICIWGILARWIIDWLGNLKVIACSAERISKNLIKNTSAACIVQLRGCLKLLLLLLEISLEWLRILVYAWKIACRVVATSAAAIRWLSSMSYFRR